MNEEHYGIVGEFLEPEQLLVAAREARAYGYRKLDAYTPFAVDGLAEEIGLSRTGVPLAVLCCGILGAFTAYSMQFYSAVIDYPLNVGGRPLHSWPSFVPITFELTVLFGSLGGVLSMLALNGLPRLHHPIFNTPHFEERCHSRFYLCIEAADPLFEKREVHKFFSALGAAAVWEVPA